MIRRTGPREGFRRVALIVGAILVLPWTGFLGSLVDGMDLSELSEMWGWLLLAWVVGIPFCLGIPFVFLRVAEWVWDGFAKGGTE